MTHIDEFYERVATEIAFELDAGERQPVGAESWIVVQDEVGVVRASRVDLGKPQHEILSELIDRGADAAAVVSYFPGDPGKAVAQVLIGHPQDSDVREATVPCDPEGRTVLAPWKRVV